MSMVWSRAGIPARLGLAVAAGALSLAGTAPAAWAGSGAGATTPGPATTQQEAQLAQSRLAANLRQPHPGRPEAITHPAEDHAGSGLAASSPALRPAAHSMVIQPTTSSGSGPQGLDVSDYQGDVNWSQVYQEGGRFAYVKATEGTYYTSSYFAQQYDGSYQAGLIRGAYHFAIPDNSSGAAQADYFVANGGGWSPDGRTLPGMLDIEFNPYGSNECYGLSPSQMVGWISSFVNEYRRLTGRLPDIYTNTYWWDACTGDSGAFGSDTLSIANYGSSPSPLPPGWGTWTIWQYADSGLFPGDEDVFNGSYQQLVSFAQGYPLTSTTTSLRASSSSPATGQAVTLTATVSPAPPGGSVTFKNGAEVECSGVSLASGQASCQATFPDPGTKSLSASYSGTQGYGASTGATQIAVVSLTDLGSTVPNGTRLSAGDYLQSANGYVLVMQADGNLVLYGPTGQATWASGTAGNQGAWASLLSDGNLVVYSAAGQALWSTGTWANQGVSLTLGTGGVATIYDQYGHPLWATTPAPPASAPGLAPGAAQSPSGEELAAVTAPDGSVSVATTTASGSWTPAYTIGGRAVGGPAVASPATGVFDVFVRGTDNGVWENRYQGGSWSGWHSLGGIITAPPGATAYGGQVYVAARGAGSTGGLWERLADTTSAWRPMGGSAAAGTGPAPAMDQSGDLAVFYAGSNQATWQYRAGTYTSLGGTASFGPAASSPWAQHLEVFASQGGGELWHRWWDSAQGWSAWYPLGGVLSSGPAVAAYQGSGHQDVFALGSDGRLWHDTSINGSWGSWQLVP
jgi:GH25 family lysozyme M1 (1,4-beta-N-acetylmuramidase)